VQYCREEKEQKNALCWWKCKVPEIERRMNPSGCPFGDIQRERNQLPGKKQTQGVSMAIPEKMEI